MNLKVWIQRTALVLALPLTVLGLSFVWKAEQLESLFEVQTVPVEWINRAQTNAVDLEIASLVEAEIGRRLSSVLGAPIWSIDLDRFESLVRTIPWVSDVRLHRRLPNRISVAVETKVPSLMVMDTDSSTGAVQLYAVDQNGVLISDWKSQHVLPQLPFVRGGPLSGAKESAVKLRATLSQTFGKLPSTGFVAPKNIAEVFYKQGFVVSLRQPQVDVFLGETTSAAELVLKLKRVSRVLEYLQHKKISVQVLDATSVKKVVVRSEQRP